MLNDVPASLKSHNMRNISVLQAYWYKAAKDDGQMEYLHTEHGNEGKQLKTTHKKCFTRKSGYSR